MKLSKKLKRSCDALVSLWTQKGRKREKWQEHIDDFVSFYGRWPGHEANYPLLNRLLWEIGKRELEKERRKMEDGRGKGRSKKVRG